MSQPDLDPQRKDRQQVDAFLALLRGNAELQQALKSVTTAAGIAEVAAAAGFPLTPATLVRDFAQRLLEADDARVVRNFDNCGWDQGELAWVLKTWE